VFRFVRSYIRLFVLVH